MRKKKELLIGVTLSFVVGALLGYFIVPILTSFGAKEKSFKTGRFEPRYLKAFKRTPFTYPPENIQLLNISPEKIDAIEKLWNETGQYVKRFSWFPAIENEHVFVYIIDLGNLRFTIDIDDGKYTIKRGFDESRPPTIVVPIMEQNILNLRDVFSDGKLTYEEQYRIYYVLAIPALQALYNTDPLYTPWDKSMLKFDDLVHIEIPPEEPVFLLGHPISIQATAVNVDGQWLVFPGFQGDPDFKVSLTLEQATKLYVAGIYEVRGAKSVKELLDVSKRFLKFLEEVIVYVRPDHR